MDVKQAIAKAREYILDVYSDEPISNIGLEETEFDSARDVWQITFAFSRLWNTPKSRAQEVLESLGGSAQLKRSYKVIGVAADGAILFMKDRSRMEAAE